jgi:hypothetical protein
MFDVFAITFGPNLVKIPEMLLAPTMRAAISGENH